MHGRGQQEVPGLPDPRTSNRMPMNRSSSAPAGLPGPLRSFIAALLLSSGHLALAAEPAASSGRTEAYHLALTNGSELQVRIAVSATNKMGTLRGIAHHLQTNKTCVFEERQDFRWWQTTLDVACGATRVVLRLESPSLATDAPQAVGVPSMVKLMVGEELHVWTIAEGTPKDTKAAALGQAAIRRLPETFRQVVGDLAMALLSDEFIAEAAHAPAGFALLGEVLDIKHLEAELTALRPLTATESEALVRLAADTK